MSNITQTGPLKQISLNNEDNSARTKTIAAGVIITSLVVGILAILGLAILGTMNALGYNLGTFTHLTIYEALLGTAGGAALLSAGIGFMVYRAKFQDNQQNPSSLTHTSAATLDDQPATLDDQPATLDKHQTANKTNLIIPKSNEMCRMVIPDSCEVYSGKQPGRVGHHSVILKGPGGAADIGYMLTQRDPKARIGVQIAGNSGATGGMCWYHFEEGKLIGDEEINYTTQEESVLGNVIKTLTHDLGENQAAEAIERQILWYEKTLKNQWGMKDFEDGSNKATIQGPDFTTTNEAQDYHYAHIVQDLSERQVRLSPLQGGYKNRTIRGDVSYPVTLIFSCAVNAHATGKSPTSTMTRTLNRKAQLETAESFPFFVECIKHTMRSALDGAYLAGVEYPIMALAGAGIYAGNQGDERRNFINNQYQNLLDEVLAEEVSPNNKRGQFFKGVILGQLGKYNVSDYDQFTSL